MSICPSSPAACVATNEVKKYGGSRLLNFLWLDLHNHRGRAGTEHICLKILCLPQSPGPDERPGLGWGQAEARLWILLMERTFHLQREAGQGLGTWGRQGRWGSNRW